MKLMTCHVYGNGSLRLEYGIRASWNKDQKRHCIQLCSRSSSNGVQIPIVGEVHRGKGTRGATLYNAQVEQNSRRVQDGTTKEFTKLIPIEKDDDPAARTRDLPLLVRIDLRMRVKDSIGVGGWYFDRTLSAGTPELLAIGRSMNGQRGRKHQCFDGLMIVQFGQHVRIYPQGKHGMQYLLQYNEHGLQLIQTADFNQEKVQRVGRAREFARQMKERFRLSAVA